MLNRIRLIKKAIAKEGFDVGVVVVREESYCKPINVIVTAQLDSTVRASVVEGLQKLKSYKMDFSLKLPEALAVGM